LSVAESGSEKGANAMRFTAFAAVLALLILGNAQAQAQSCHDYPPASASAATASIPNMTVNFNAVVNGSPISDVFSDPASFQLQVLWDSPGDLLAHASGNDAAVILNVFTLCDGNSLFQGTLTNTAVDFGNFNISPYNFSVTVRGGMISGRESAFFSDATTPVYDETIDYTYDIRTGLFTVSYNLFEIDSTPLLYEVSTTSGTTSFTWPRCSGSSDQRDLIMRQYVTFGVIDSTSGNPFVPGCSDFTQTAHPSQFFSFADLNVKNVYSWALIRMPLVISQSAGYGLEKWASWLAPPNYPPRHINSAYRTPAYNAGIGVSRSRHMFGDAVDMRNESGLFGEWLDMKIAALLSGADWTEPINGPCGLACVHADWRLTAGPYAP
jgi:hypothetical protein